MKKKCELENCTKNATYAYFHGKPERCKEHKENRKPQYKICTCGLAQPSYNYKGEKKPMYCSKCKEPEMVDVKSKRCCDCDTIPNFNYISRLLRLLYFCLDGITPLTPPLGFFMSPFLLGIKWI